MSDAIIQENNTTFPTDAKLRKKVIEKWNKIKTLLQLIIVNIMFVGYDSVFIFLYYTEMYQYVKRNLKKSLYACKKNKFIL